MSVAGLVFLAIGLHRVPVTLQSTNLSELDNGRRHARTAYYVPLILGFEPLRPLCQRNLDNKCD